MMNRKMKRILAAVSAAAVIISSGAPSMPGAQVMASEEDTASVESAAVNSQDDAGASVGKTGAEAAAASQETESSASGAAEDTVNADDQKNAAAENNSGAAETDSRAVVNSGDAEESGSTDSSSASSESTSEYNEESADVYSTIDSSEESADAESAETEASDAEKSDVALHIHYEAGEGGSVTVSEEEAAVSSAEDEISLQGSEAVPSEGYEFAGWEKDDAEISSEAKFTPSIDLSQYFEGDTALTEEADLTYTAVFAVKEEKTKYPAIDFGKISFEDGSSVAVSAPEGAFPEGTKLSVTTVPAGDVLDEMKEASGEEALTEENVAAYEFNFYTEKDGVRSDGIEPLKDIRVSFENPAIEGSSPIDVYHVDEESAPQKLETAETSEPSDDSVKTVIETAQFSTYVLMSAPAEKAHGPFRFNGTITLLADIWHGGKENGDDSTRIQSVKPGDTVTLTAAVDVKEVKEKLDAIAGYFGVVKDEYGKIAITAPMCTFTATFDIPEGFAVPDETAVQVSPDGLGSCFDVTKTNISGRKITVTFGLKSGIDNYQKLYEAVNSTGIKTALSDGNDTITFTIAGLMVNGENKSDRDVLKIAGDVSGNFQAIATLDRNPDATSQGQSYYFAFTFEPSQTESGKDINADSKNPIPISISYRLSKPLNLILPGDMTTEGAADSRAIRDVQPGSRLTYVGRLDVSSIKEQINTMEGSERDHNIRNVKSSFRAVITLGDGLSSSADKNSVTLTDNNLFEISDVTVDGSTVTVDMTLKGDYASFTKLKETVDSVNDILEVRVPVTVSDSLPSVALITSIGTLSGEFSAEVVDEKGQVVLYEPSFTWNAKQAGEGTASALGNGKDSAQSESDNDAIAYTVRTPSLYQLPGDISILLGDGSEDTENSQIYQTRVGDTLTLIGSLDVTSIVNQLNTISNEHNDPDGSKISLINADREPGVSFTFTLKAEIPEGISLSDVKAEAVSSTFGNNAFTIRKVEVDGRELTVHFGLADESIKTFDRLAAAVRQVGVMKIKISGLTVTAAGQQTVRVKSLTGSFLSCASNDSKELPFNFSWETVQSTAGGLLSNSLGEGKDAAQAADDNTTIAFTFDAAPLPIPVPVPVQPENRLVVPSGNSGNPTPIVVRRMTTINGSGSKPATEQLPTISGSDGDEPVDQMLPTISGSYGDEPVDQTLPTIDGSIHTGDDQNMVLWFVFMAAAGAALVAFLARKRERNGK